MTATGIWTATFVASAAFAASAQPPPCCFLVLNPVGQPVMRAKLANEPYKPGIAPTVEWNLGGDKTVLDKKGRVISGLGFYGWMDGASIRVAVMARLPPEGAENRLYGWPELNRTGRKPHLEVFATYALRADETRSMDELQTLGVEAVALRTESTLPDR